MSAADCIQKLADKKTALEGIQGFESLFAGANEKERTLYYSHVPKLMEACGDKQKPVAQAAAALVNLMYAECQPWSGGYLLPFLKDALQSKSKPEIKAVACGVLTDFARKYPGSLSLEIEWCVGLLSTLMNDVKKEVKEKATAAMTAVSQCSGNKYLEKFTDTIVKAL
jgi:elongation factor 3